MEYLVPFLFGALILWNFYLHGKVKEKSIAAKTQQFIRDWKTGKTWESDFATLAPGEGCKVVRTKQGRSGVWITWWCSCKHKGHCQTTQFTGEVANHKFTKKQIGV